MRAGPFEYLNDPRDRALCGLTPTLMAPRFGTLAPPPVGQHRYVLAANGLFLQARSRVLDVCVKAADTGTLPYGTVSEYVRMASGRMPHHLFEQMRELAVAACPTEWAGVVVVNSVSGEYELHEPAVESAGMGHIRYSTSGYEAEDMILDVHSHGGGKAYFSSTDNESDSHGIYLASVLGHCSNPASVEAVTRIVVNGQFFPVPWTAWEDCGTEASWHAGT